MRLLESKVLIYAFLMLLVFAGFKGVSSVELTGTDLKVGLTPNSPGVATLGNNVLQVSVETNPGSSGIGTYTICTGPDHTDPGQDVLYDGCIQGPWSTYNTIHVVDTSVDYVTTNYTPNPDPGYTLANLDGYSPSVITQTATRIVIQWLTLEGLLVEQDIEVMGSTVEDTYVRVTMKVNNTDDAGALHMVGIRYMWDLMIDGEDGSWIRPWDGTPGTWLDVETSWTPPDFQNWETTNDPASPIFSVLGSITLPSVNPPPTPPDTFMMAAWGSVPSPGLYNYAYSFTPTGRTVAGADLDSAVAFYWDPVELLPLEERSVTAYIWCKYIPPAPLVGGTTVQIDVLAVTAPYILVGIAALAIGVTIIAKKRLQ